MSERELDKGEAWKGGRVGSVWRGVSRVRKGQRVVSRRTRLLRGEERPVWEFHL